MVQAFIIVLREGFEAFLIVAIITAYLTKTRQTGLLPAVYWGIAASAAASIALGWLLFQGNMNGPLWEGIFGLVSAIFVGGLVVHMWRHAAVFKKEVEAHLAKAAEQPTTAAASLGIFLFTVLMISREGMETALLMMQVQDAGIWTGAALGAAAAGAFALLWGKFGHRINLKLFFQVTAIFLLLFVVQILFNAAHEFSEAGIVPDSEAFHKATEPFSHDGYYGKWFGVGMVGVCAVWLIGASVFTKAAAAVKHASIAAIALILGFSSPALAAATAPKMDAECPVMLGKKARMDRFYDYEDGKRLYLCCKGCVKKAKKAPAKYRNAAISPVTPTA